MIQLFKPQRTALARIIHRQSMKNLELVRQKLILDGLGGGRDVVFGEIGGSVSREGDEQYFELNRRDFGRAERFSWDMILS